MKRVMLNLLLVVALVLGVVAPVFAQDDTPDSPALRELLKGSLLRDVSEHPKYSGRIPTYGGSKSMNNKIDYLLLSSRLFDRMVDGAVEISGVYAPKSGAPFEDLKSKQDQASDHGLLWADIDI